MYSVLYCTVLFSFICAKCGMVSIKHDTILYGVDSARPIAHENTRAPYRLDTPWFSTVSIVHESVIQKRLGTGPIVHESVMQKRLGTGSIVHESVMEKRFGIGSIVHASFMQNRFGAGSIVHESAMQKRAPARLCTVTTVHQWWSILLRQRNIFETNWNSHDYE